MRRHVAFLRGMNLGRRRITNVELCRCLDGLGFANVAAFLASGNVVFEHVAAPDRALESQIEQALANRLGYEVPVFLRSDDELAEIAARSRFSDEEIADSQGKEQVVFLATEPSADARAAVPAHATNDERLAFAGRRLGWLPKEGISTSELDLAAIEKVLGPFTVRTLNTVRRLRAKFFDE